MPTLAATKQGRRPRRQFDDDFRAQAVRLVLDEGKTVGAAARDLDLTPSVLRRWVEQARADRTRGRTGLTTAEREELARRDVSERLFMSLLDASLSIPALQRILESVALLRQRLDVDTELVVLQCAGRHFDDADQPVVLVEREGHELIHRVASPGPRQRRRLHSTGWPTFRPTFFDLY